MSKGRREDFPPGNAEFERQLLGSLLLEPTLLEKPWMTGIQPQCFADEAHGQILAAMQELRQFGKPVNLPFLVEQLKSQLLNGQCAFEAVGGTAYLARVANCVATHADVRFYADEVRENHQRRQLCQFGYDVARQAIDGLPPSDIGGWIRHSLESGKLPSLSSDEAPLSLRQLRAKHCSLRPAVRRWRPQTFPGPSSQSGTPRPWSLSHE